MTDVASGTVVSMSYEHRKGDGTLVSKGYVEVDKDGVHSIQETPKGRVIATVLGRLRLRKCDV